MKSSPPEASQSLTPSRTGQNCVRSRTNSNTGTKGLLIAWALLLAVCFSLGGCSKEEPELLTREQMWVWVGQHVQVGMPLEAASEALQKAGFVCQRFTKTAAKIIDIHKAATEGTFDFVRGEREDGLPPIKRHWEITLVHDGSKIGAIGVRYRDVYPGRNGGTEKPEH